MAIPLPLLHALLTGPWRTAPGRNLIGLLTVALGVALGMATYLITASAANEAARAAASLYGEADLVVQGPADGFDESLYPLLARLPEVRIASPVVDVRVRLRGAGQAEGATLRVLGIDPFRAGALAPGLRGVLANGTDFLSARALWLSPAAAARHGLGAVADIVVQGAGAPVSMRVAGVLEGAPYREPLALGDIGTVQWLLGQGGHIQRVELRLADGVEPARAAAAVAQRLPPGVFATTPAGEGAEAAELTRAYRANLTALSLVALLTGAFIIFSAQMLAVVERRHHLALLRCLGLTRFQLAAWLLAEGALLGLAGGVCGAAAGAAFAHQALLHWGPDLGAGYFVGLTASRADVFGPGAAFAALGALAATLGAALPALEAARVHPARALRVGEEQAALSARARPRRFLPAALACLAFAGPLLLLPPVDGLPLGSYAAIACLLLAVTLASPAVVHGLHRLLPSPSQPALALALARSRHAAGHAAVALAGLLVSFSLMVAMAIMVASFRQSLDEWLARVLPADVYLRVGYARDAARFDAATVERLRALPQARAVEFTRYTEAAPATGKPPVVVIARDAPGGDGELLWLTRSAPTPGPGAVVWVSEAAEALHGWVPGSRIRLPLAGREADLRVAGVWRDYARQGGAVVLDRALYVRLTGDTAVNAVALWAADGVAPDVLAQAARGAMAPDAAFDLARTGELRAQSLRIFDRTFAVTYVLEAVAVVIGLFGIGAASAAQALARRGEFGMLRHLGLTRREVLGMLGAEGALLGVAGVLAGSVSGWLVSLILVHGVNRQSFHWSMDIHPPWGQLGVLALTLVILSALTAVAAGRTALRGGRPSATKEAA